MARRLTQRDLQVIDRALAVLDIEISMDDEAHNITLEECDRVRRKIWDRMP